MKKLIVIALLMASTAAYAADAPAKPSPADKAAARQAKFTEVKSHRLETISKYLAALQEEQSCVQAANDRKALKACKNPMHHGGRKHAKEAAPASDTGKQ